MTDQDHGQNAPQPASEARGLRNPPQMSQRTPGPWFAVWNGNYWEINIDDDQYAHTVAAVWARVPSVPDGAEADARLIAAAPDLLEALRKLTTDITSDQVLMDAVSLAAFEDACAAIAKAEGRT
jgi:hypothetical protein